ncbi:MAG TPA: ABC transporter ATP-binding protein, partial [Gemmatimonadaceae bacterium]|nr:ABC transporter ATP-binding protein [Gemmatimonadaceae bacterium]
GLTDPQTLVLIASLGTLCLFILKGVYLALSLRISFGFIYHKMLSLSRQLLNAYLHTSYLFHLQHNTAQLIRNTIAESEQVAGILKFCIVLPTEFLVILGLVVVLFVAHPPAALGGTLLLGGVGWGLSTLTRRRLARLGQTRTDQYARMIQCVNQSLGGLKEIKVLGKESFFLRAFEASGFKYNEALRKSTLLAQYPRLAIETAAAAALVLFIVMLITLGGDIQNLLPTLALFGLAMVRLVPSASRIMNAVNTIRFYAPAVTNVLDSLEETRRLNIYTPAAAQETIQLKKSLRLDHLGYTYPGSGVRALDDITLEIFKGQKVAFVGSSGAGKTTLANLILGLLQPTSGEILEDGRNVQNHLPSWQRQIGYIPQDIFLLDDTVRRNVAFGLPDEEIDDPAVWRALEAAQLASFVRELDPGLDSQVGERGVRISAGQRQRVGIARALYHDPKVVLLDEATSALDNETERLFIAAIESIARRKTILIIAHRLSTVRNCDTIYLMQQGRVIGAGGYDELLATQPAFAQLVHPGREPQPA